MANAILAKEPQDLESAQVLGDTYLNEEEFTKALEVYDRYLPGDITKVTRAQLGLLLCETGRCAEAAEQYRQALKVDPKSAVAHNELAWFLATAAEFGLRDAADAGTPRFQLTVGREATPA